MNSTRYEYHLWVDGKLRRGVIMARDRSEAIRKAIRMHRRIVDPKAIVKIGIQEVGDVERATG